MSTELLRTLRIECCLIITKYKKRFAELKKAIGTGFFVFLSAAYGVIMLMMTKWFSLARLRRVFERNKINVNSVTYDLVNGGRRIQQDL